MVPSADYIAAPRSQEDDVHNVQSVIDSLALDYLQISLSHITGELPVPLLVSALSFKSRQFLFYWAFGLCRPPGADVERCMSAECDAFKPSKKINQPES